MIPIKILGKRKNGEFYLKTIRKINRTDDISEIARQLYYDYSIAVEVSYLITFDLNGDIINICQIATGSLNEVDVFNRIIASCLVLSGMVNWFSIIHNHPSGNMDASTEDLDVARRINLLSAFLEIQFYESIVATENGCSTIWKEEDE